MQEETESILNWYGWLMTTHEVIDDSSTMMYFYASFIETYAWNAVIHAVDVEVPWKRVMMTERFGRN